MLIIIFKKLISVLRIRGSPSLFYWVKFHVILDYSEFFLFDSGHLLCFKATFFTGLAPVTSGWDIDTKLFGAEEINFRHCATTSIMLVDVHLS